MHGIGILGAVVLAAGAGPAFAGGDPGGRERVTGAWPADDVVFHSRVDLHSDYKDVWGYTAPDGREFALLTTSFGLSVVDVTQRRRPRETGFVPGPFATHRDVKTLGSRAYVVMDHPSGEGAGLQIVDLSFPDTPFLAAQYRGFRTAHNLWIDETTSTAWVAGTDVGIGGVLAYDLSNPLAPAPAGQWNGAYAHDVHARGDLVLVSAIWDGALYLLQRDGTDLDAIGAVSGYPDAFTHNAWLTDDGRHVLTTDEKSGAFTRMWNIEDPASPFETDRFSPWQGPRSIPHNVHVDGELAYISHYTTGVRIVDISDPGNLTEVGWWDTEPATNAGIFSGCWGVFPHYPLSPGLFVASDISSGLWILEYDGPPASGPGSAPRAPAPVPAGIARLALGRPAPHPARAGAAVTVPLRAEGVFPLVARVHDAAGRLVRTLAPAPGAGRVDWDGRDGAGRAVAAGTYFLCVEGAGESRGRRLVVLR